MIEIQGLKKSYGSKLVLDGVHLTVPDGAKFGLVGINGAGKSTLLRLIADVLRPDEGSILLDGECVTGNAKKREELFFLPDDPYYASGTRSQSSSTCTGRFTPLIVHCSISMRPHSVCSS